MFILTLIEKKLEVPGMSRSLRHLQLSILSHTCFFEKNSRTFKSTTISCTFECTTNSRTAEVQAHSIDSNSAVSVGAQKFWDKFP